MQPNKKTVSFFFNRGTPDQAEEVREGIIDEDDVIGWYMDFEEYFKWRPEDDSDIPYMCDLGLEQFWEIDRSAKRLKFVLSKTPTKESQPLAEMALNFLARAEINAPRIQNVLLLEFVLLLRRGYAHVTVYHHYE